MIKLRTKTVSTIPSAHTTLDLNILESLPICILSDILDTIPSDVPTSISGINTEEIKFPHKRNNKK